MLKSQVLGMHLQVNRALQGFDRLGALHDLAAVDEDAEQYNAEMHDRIFVAEQVETLLHFRGNQGMSS